MKNGEHVLHIDERGQNGWKGFANTGASLGVIREIHKAEKNASSKKS